MMNEATLRSRLRAWIVERARVGPAPELGDDTPLLTSGLLTSLDVAELVLFIEELRGEEIDSADLVPSAFASLETIWQTFFLPLGRVPVSAA
jgi:acyl carrier protein